MTNSLVLLLIKRSHEGEINLDMHKKLERNKRGVSWTCIKKMTLVSALQDCALTWYIKHSNVIQMWESQISKQC